MITQRELDTFQSCRAKWHLQIANNLPLESESQYEIAIKRTVFQMYSWLQEKEKLMTETQVKDRWDRNFLACVTTDDIPSIESAANGWLMLKKFWEEKYLVEANLYPIGVNFEFSTYIYDVHYRIHIDILLADKDGNLILRQLGSRATPWGLYSQLSTKLEVTGIAEVMNKVITKKSNISISKADDVTINITPQYYKSCSSIIASISRDIRDRAIYASPGSKCDSCPVADKCWF